jgi:hypothetical protein
MLQFAGLQPKPDKAFAQNVRRDNQGMRKLSLHAFFYIYSTRDIDAMVILKMLASPNLLHICLVVQCHKSLSRFSSITHIQNHHVVSHQH